MNHIIIDHNNNITLFFLRKKYIGMATCSRMPDIIIIIIDY